MSADTPIFQCPRKVLNITLTLSLKKNYISITKDCVRLLGIPVYVGLRINSEYDAIAFIPCTQTDYMSFRIPDDLFTNKSSYFKISGKQFIEELAILNNLSMGSTYRIQGGYSKEENALIFKLKNITKYS